MGGHAQVTLYCWDKGERRLLEYLQTARDSLGKPWYEPQFALRVARQHSRLNACVQLLCELKLHEVRLLTMHTPFHTWQPLDCSACLCVKDVLSSISVMALLVCPV